MDQIAEESFSDYVIINCPKQYRKLIMRISGEKNIQSIRNPYRLAHNRVPHCIALSQENRLGISRFLIIVNVKCIESMNYIFIAIVSWYIP